MGTSSAIISYGIAVSEDDQNLLPWASDEFDGSEEEWWLQRTGYTPPFELYDATTENGYIDNIEPDRERIFEYFAHRRQWLADNPMPFKVKSFGYHGNCLIVTAPSYPYYQVELDSINFNPSDLVALRDEAFEAFVERYLPSANPSAWILAAKLS